MKWRRKNSAPSWSYTSLITRVFQGSWFFKLKQRNRFSETNSEKIKQRGELGFTSPYSSLPAGRFYDFDDDDTYWRLSFSKERIEGRRRRRRNTGGMNSVWYDSDDVFQIPISNFKSFGLREMKVPRRRGSRKFNEMVLNIKKMKEKKKQGRFSRENDAFRSNNGLVESMNDHISRKTKKQVELEKGCDEGEEEKSSKLMERGILENQPEIEVQIKDEYFWKNSFSFPKFDQISVEKDCKFEALNELQTLKDNKMKEIKIKSDCQRNSSYINRGYPGRKTKVKAYSPRTECKIRALEDMKKARMKLQKKTERQMVEGRTVFDSFSVVKNSFNPQQDFRDSMLEMITEKEIRRSEELEELLVCYLKLNCDEYHDIIIDVFRHVWFELNQAVDYELKDEFA